ncbi:MAG: hypothetical protein NTY36_03010 [Deltaproteobacteria bacterium]|nr:hypothetical protein [Deltaproteobacteria bacterium]
MKINDLTKPVVVAFLMICLCLLSAAVCQGGTLSDNFDGNAINTRLWKAFQDSQNQRVFQEQGELRIQIDGTSVGKKFSAGLNSKFLLKGNFQISVDFRMITWPAGNGTAMGLQSTSTSPLGFFLQRLSLGTNDPLAAMGTDGYMADFLENHGSLDVFRPFSPVDHGSLKIKRIGQQLTAYLGLSGSWIEISGYTYRATFPEWMAITLQANNGWFDHWAYFGGKDVDIAFDNFLVTYDQIKYISDQPRVPMLLLD